MMPNVEKSCETCIVILTCRSKKVIPSKDRKYCYIENPWHAKYQELKKEFEDYKKMAFAKPGSTLKGDKDG